MYKVEVKNVTKTFMLSKKQQKIEKTDVKVKVAVNDLSFEINTGEIYGLLGPNGAGKTTTLRMMASLIKADSGDILIDSISVKDHPDEIRSHIGFLTSELKLDDFFTPNYTFNYFGLLHGLDSKTILERRERLFKQFGIDAFQEVKIADLSSGMKQKISLVTSIVHDPSLIIFDEPTNGLDIITAKTVTDFLLDLKAQGKTIILSTHIFSLVEKLCDRVGIIIDGKMHLSSTVSDILKEDSLENVFFRLYESREQHV